MASTSKKLGTSFSPVTSSAIDKEGSRRVRSWGRIATIVATRLGIQALLGRTTRSLADIVLLLCLVLGLKRNWRSRPATKLRDYRSEGEQQFRHVLKRINRNSTRNVTCCNAKMPTSRQEVTAHTVVQPIPFAALQVAFQWYDRRSQACN